jgi:hypothetical protein
MLPNANVFPPPKEQDVVPEVLGIPLEEVHRALLAGMGRLFPQAAEQPVTNQTAAIGNSVRPKSVLGNIKLPSTGIAAVQQRFSKISSEQVASAQNYSQRRRNETM